MTPDGAFLYISQYESQRVMVISTATRQVVDTIPLSHPLSLTVTPDGKHLWVSTFDYSSRSGVAIVETATNNLVDSFPVSDGEAAFFRFSPDSATVYSGGHDMVIYSAATKQVAQQFHTGSSDAAVVQIVFGPY